MIAGDPSTYPPTTILRNNPGMVRETWMTDDGWLVIRQTKYGPDGSEPATKVIRLSPEEQVTLREFLIFRLAQKPELRSAG
jgi:hypothetical protein